MTSGGPEGAGNQYYMDMINLRKKLKKEEDNRRLFTEQAKKKDEEVKRLTLELEQVKSSQTHETESQKKERLLQV